MLIKSAINKAKAQEAEKVAISLKVPIDIKTRLQEIADENNISLNNLCASLLESVLDGDLDQQGTMKLLQMLDEAKESLYNLESEIARGNDFITSTDGVDIDFTYETEILSAKIAAITAELKRRGSL